MTSDARTDRIVEFFDAAYDFQSHDQAWLEGVMNALRAVWSRGVAVHGGIYDATDIHAVRWPTVFLDGFTSAGADAVMRGQRLVSPRIAALNLRHYVVEMKEAAYPELEPLHEELAALGLQNTLYVNALDPEYVGVLVAIWCREPDGLAPSDRDLFRRLAHHLSAAHRCRRRLRDADGSSRDTLEGAAAILDAQLRVVHAEGAVTESDEQGRLVEHARAREKARTTGPDLPRALERYHPLASAEWTLVDGFERSGTRFIVARENQVRVRGVTALSGRERQAVAYLAAGQSTKETAYALGISANTVRVLLGRAATKLGVRTRRDLLAHPEVKALGFEAGLAPDPD